MTEIPFVPPHESIEEELAASHVAAGHLRGRDSVLKAGQYLGDLRREPWHKFATPRWNAPEDGPLQVRVQRMVLDFLRDGVR